MTPEEIKEEKKRRRLLARFRFRCLIRKVITSRYWLMEMEKQPFGDNIKRNVAIICRHQRATCPITIAEKSILNLPGHMRTKHQDSVLAQKLLGVQCLAGFPPSLRLSMIKKMQYMYYQRNRMITREGHNPSAIYFILDGRVSILKTLWDPIERKSIEFVSWTKATGDIFGHMAPLCGTKRLITAKTASDCELLILYIDDLNDQIFGILKQQWSDIRLAVSRFEYFSKFSESQIRECCFISRLQKYEEDEIIFSETHGFNKFTHIVCSGKCMILQCLKLKKTKLKSGKKKIELVQIDPDENSKKPREKNQTQIFGQPLDCDQYPPETQESIENIDFSEQDLDHESHAESVQAEVSDPNVSYEVKFTNVGLLHCGSIFGLGEKMEHRSVVAKTTVDCLLVPRIWLFQKEQNTGNTFQSLKMFLDSTIPSRQKLFDIYISDIDWMKYRKDLIKKMIDTTVIRNPTQHYDIPVTCRILEMKDE